MSVPLHLIFLSRKLGIPPGEVFRTHLPWLWRFLLLASACVAVGQAWRPRGMVELILAGALGCGLYAWVMWPVVQHSPLRSYVVPRLLAVWAGLGEAMAAARRALAGRPAADSPPMDPDR